MQKPSIQYRFISNVLKHRCYSSYSLPHIIQPKPTLNSSNCRYSEKKTSTSAYWSLLEQDKRNDFTFNVESSKAAIHDATFMQRLLLQAVDRHTTPPDTQSALISQCHDFFQLLDTPDQLLFLRHFSNSYHHQQSIVTFLHSLYQLPGGVKRIIDFRGSLLTLLRHYPCEHSILAPLESILKSSIKVKLLSSDSQLSIGRITWQSASPEVIEKLCRYEAVHAVSGLQDIKRRLAPDRRVYALFAKGLPKEPLVFVHVALVSELSNSIQTILEPYNRSTNHNIHDSRYAICYSITTQQGLGGIHLGNYLIRRVVDQLQQTYSQIHTFATLSPIPGFRQWLNEQLSKDPSLWEQLVQAGGTTHWEQMIKDVPKDSPLATKLLHLCARYILDAKRPNNGSLDPVANFHLRNGACAHQLHWQGDVSDKGVNESFGIMINYNYIPSKLDDHHNQYINHGTIFVSEPQSSPSRCLSDYIGRGAVLMD
ncbi:hypothetical protein [Absidia glauca]|uniref:Malonyl-CoA decarboxylase C-terminal domain-containing protein n=1 Tax=Absidia glauca TaxID=4829 RepID=A0A163KWV4_ABSGL|nr:hypothetical protein [Absidia glauca]